MKATKIFTAPRLWMLCVAFGVAVIGFVSWFARVIPEDRCTGDTQPGVSTLMEFQLANTSADLEIIFGPADDPCRVAMIEAMDLANQVDLFGFIETYTMFLTLFFLAARKEQIATGAVRAGLWAVGAAVTFDGLETAMQLMITDFLPPSEWSMWALWIGSRVKFLGLAGVCFAAGAVIWARDGRRFARIAGWSCIAGGVLVLVGLLLPAARAALGPGSAICWLMMLAYAAVAAFGRRPAIAAA